MEIRLYRSLQKFAENSSFLTVRVECPDLFEYSKTLDVFKTLYGSNIVFVVIQP